MVKKKEKSKRWGISSSCFWVIEPIYFWKIHMVRKIETGEYFIAGCNSCWVDYLSLFKYFSDVIFFPVSLIFSVLFYCSNLEWHKAFKPVTPSDFIIFYVEGEKQSKPNLVTWLILSRRINSFRLKVKERSCRLAANNCTICDWQDQIRRLIGNMKWTGWLAVNYLLCNDCVGEKRVGNNTVVRRGGNIADPVEMMLTANQQ